MESFNFKVFRGVGGKSTEEYLQSEQEANRQTIDFLNNSANHDNKCLESRELAELLDTRDDLKALRNEFNYPDMIPLDAIHDNNNDDQVVESDCVTTRVLYFCGNSLGLQPKSTEKCIEKELKKWKHVGVEGHFSTTFGTNKWFEVEESVKESMAKVVGAKPVEVTVMNSLTTNLHILLMSFYRPTADKYKILFEQNPFPSDMHALTSHIRCRIGELRPLLGNDLTDDQIVEKCLVQVGPRDGERTIRTEDIVECLKTETSLAVSLVGGVQFMTGQCFDMETIAKTCQNLNIVCGFDLAHAAGNIDLHLHDWGVDFACWCSYKYLNSGPGNMSGIFVHEKHANENMEQRPRFMGWWSRAKETRFSLSNKFEPQPGASGFQLSNPCILSMTAVLASLKVFESVSETNIMGTLRKKSLVLTTYLELLIRKLLGDKIEILTPTNPKHRGCQLSIRVLVKPLEYVDNELKKKGIIIDTREPDIIRVSPTPLYNQYVEVFDFVQALKDILEK